MIGVNLRVIVPFRQDIQRPERLANLQSCLISLQNQTFNRPSFSVVLIDQNSHPHPLPKAIADLADLYWVDSWDGPFNRSRAINCGMKQVSRAGYMAIVDADLVIDDRFIADAYRHLAQVPIALPYDRVVYLDAETSANVRQRVNAGLPWDGNGGYRIKTGAVGGALYMRADAFFDLQGYDENFIGWGAEDNDFFWRAERQFGKVLRRSAQILHLWHPRPDKFPPENVELLYQKHPEKRPRGAL